MKLTAGLTGKSLFRDVYSISSWLADLPHDNNNNTPCPIYDHKALKRLFASGNRIALPTPVVQR